jgi:hypothetical protein
MRCPVCRAEVDQGPQCRRCRADLALLFTLEDERRASLREACRAAAAGRPGRMLAFAGWADGLRQGADSARLLALAHLLRRDFAAAWQVYTSRLRPES